MSGLTTCGELREHMHNYELEGSLINCYWVWLVILSRVVSRSTEGLFVGSYDEAIL
jgi:hypothetical protein